MQFYLPHSITPAASLLLKIYLCFQAFKIVCPMFSIYTYYNEFPFYCYSSVLLMLAVNVQKHFPEHLRLWQLPPEYWRWYLKLSKLKILCNCLLLYFEHVYVIIYKNFCWCITLQLDLN